MQKKKSSSFCKSYVLFWDDSKINKPMRDTRQTASTIDHIITNSIMHTGFKLGIVKSGISNHFPIFFCYKYIVEKEDAKKKFWSDSPISQLEHLS